MQINNKNQDHWKRTISGAHANMRACAITVYPRTQVRYLVLHPNYSAVGGYDIFQQLLCYIKTCMHGSSYQPGRFPLHLPSSLAERLPIERAIVPDYLNKKSHFKYLCLYSLCRKDFLVALNSKLHS